MARYEVEGPDGSRYEVTMPEGMTPEQISTRLREHFASMGITAKPVQPQAPAAPAPRFGGLDFSRPAEEVRAGIQALPQDQRKDAFNEWAKTYVANERKGGGVMQGIRDVGRNLARGTPVGSWLDEANANTQALLKRLGLGGSDYDEAIAYQRATDAAIDQESMKLGSLPVIGDVTMGGVQKLAGGIASAPVSPMINMMRGTTMLPRMANVGATGAAYGALYGAGEGESTMDRATNAAVGTMIGGGLGAAAPAVATGVSRLIRRAPQPQGTLGTMDRRAVANVADDMVADGRIGIRPVEPEAMIADMGPNLQGHTGAIARMPGEGKTVVIDALGATVGHGRRGGAPARIQADVDAVLGPPQNLVQLERNMLDQSRALARPYYEDFYNTPIQPTPRLQQFLDFAERTGIVRAADDAIARKRLIRPGVPVSPNMRIDYISRELNRLSEVAQTPAAGLDRTAAGQYRQIANAFRDEVDSILRATDAARRGVRPEQAISSWDMARRHAGSGLQFEQGLQRGADVFKRGTHPDQMRADMAAMSPFEDAAFRTGARGQIRDIMGEASSTLGSTGDAAIRKQLGSDFARDKLAQITGQPGADRIVNRLDTEGIYEQTRQAAVGNSVTAAMQQNLKRYGGRTDPQVSGNIPDSLWGDAKKAAGWVLNKMTAGYLDERSRRQALDAARILTAQGETRDAFIRELQDFITRRDVTQRQRAAGEELLQNVLTGTRGVAVSGAVPGGAIAAEQRP
jgi:hypothetical protein